MNLAVKDIRHNRGRFALTAVGIGMLLLVVMGMGGIYRGIVEDATLLIDSVGADLWIVQRDTRGPFAEISRLPHSLVDRLAGVPGVAGVREFVEHTIQRQREGKLLRISVVGLGWPGDRGQWLPLVAGRHLGQGHFEMVADRTLGFQLGDRIRLGKDIYSVVGITSGMISSTGDGVGFFTYNDALAIQFDLSGEAIRLAREGRRSRTAESEVGMVEPGLLERASASSNLIPVLESPSLSAVLVTMRPGSHPQAVQQILSGWSDVTVYTAEEQRQLMLGGTVERTMRQIGLFRALLTVIAGIIMMLILYTLTLDKLHSIALLKLIGAPNRVILRLILSEALLLGALGYGIAYLVGGRVFPLFPRRVLVVQADLITLAGIVLGISVLSSTLGIWKALRVQPNTALMG